MTAPAMPPLGSAAAFARVSKTFPGMKALDDVTFQITDGSFHALVGGNGSGKSTLIKILAGVYQGDPGGELRVGHSTAASDQATPTWSRAAGIRFVHQDLGLFDHLSVGENLLSDGNYPKSAGGIDYNQVHRQGQAVLDRLDVAVNSRTLMGKLRPAERTLVAIARCLRDHTNAAVHLLVLDEPTARLPHAEVQELLERLKTYAQGGQSILYVSHRLDEIIEYGDAVTVLRDGKHVMTEPLAGITRQQLTRAIVGEHRDIVGIKRSSTVDHERTPLLTVSDLNGGPLTDINFDVLPGEIVAVAGLVGSGRTSLLETIYGVHRRSGHVTLDRKTLQPGSISASIAAGLAYVPEDRARDSAFRDLGLEMNLSAASVANYIKSGWFRRGAELSDARRDVERFRIRTPGVQAELIKLSGGNQQKAIIARWLRRDPRLLLLDEPTQGVDVGARAEIYAQIEHAVTAGAGVLLVTSDLEELLHLADRVIVLDRGALTTSAQGQALTRDWVVDNMFEASQPKKDH